MTEIMAREQQDEVEGPAELFTGRVTIRGQFARDEPSRVTGAVVTFEPGARTAWHSHPLGQTLVVIEGVGWTQVENGPVQEFAAGDILLCPRDRRHWHGATPESSMSHVAIQEALDGTNVTWMEQVTDEEYLEGRSAARRGDAY
jgi:quercetin dioxygenase-like cupin family protein